MGIYLSDEEQKTIIDLYSKIDSFENINSFFKYFDNISAQLLKSEYHGFFIFPSKLSKDPIIIANNPEEYVKSYIDYLMPLDILLDDLIDNPKTVQTPNKHGIDDKKIKTYIQESNLIRPCGDYCYVPVNYQQELIGFIGYTKPYKSNDYFDYKDMHIINMIVPALNDGLQFLAFKEKQMLLSKFNEHNKNLAIIYIYNNGTVEIPCKNNFCLLEKIFHLSMITPEKIKNHPIIQNELYYLKNCNCSFLSGKSSKIIKDNKKYIVHSYAKKDILNCYNLIALITIEEQKDIFSYDIFKIKYNLTKREIEIVQAIVCGKSNKSISEKLFISETTVKKHIANIFEKTSTKSRTQLIFSLTNI